MGLKLKGTFVDIGCGIGIVTNAFLTETGIDEAIGIDISEDAIEYARQKYPKCRFYCQSADNLDNFEDNSFDVIHCKEFYPFTRTNDEQYHFKYFDLFSKKVKKNGFVIISMLEPNNFGLGNTINSIADEIEKTGFKYICRKLLLSNRMSGLFVKIKNSVFLYSILSFVSFVLLNLLSLVRKFRKKDNRLPYAYIFQKI